MSSVFPRNKVAFWVAILVLILILTLIKLYVVPMINLSKKIGTPMQLTEAVDLCAPFPVDKAGISCKDAKEIALKKYPGQLLSIEKTSRQYELGTSPTTQTKRAQVWFFNVRPNDKSVFPPAPKNTNNVKFQTTDILGIAVDRSTKEILFAEPVFKI